MLLALVLATPIIGSPAKREEAAAVQPEFEVIPGLGMPSLESLGLTSADLFNKTFVDELLAPLAKRAQPEPAALYRRWNNLCYSGGTYGVNDGIWVCAAYLFALGTKECRAGNKAIIFCSSHARNHYTSVYGISIAPGDSVAHCSESAQGVYWVPNNCQPGCDGDVCFSAGAAASQGNNNLIMIVNGDYV